MTNSQAEGKLRTWVWPNTPTGQRGRRKGSSLIGQGGCCSRACDPPTAHRSGFRGAQTGAEVGSHPAGPPTISRDIFKAGNHLSANAPGRGCEHVHFKLAFPTARLTPRGTNVIATVSCPQGRGLHAAPGLRAGPRFTQGKGGVWGQLPREEPSTLRVKNVYSEVRK